MSSDDDSKGRRPRRRWLRWLVALVVVIAAVWLIVRFNADRPVDYADDVDHFKWGSIGAEPGGSVLLPVGGMLPPEPIFEVLPEICPEMLPGDGWASLGFLFEEGHAMPIGVSQRFRLGLDQVGLNCAGCHTGTVRETPESEPEIIVGMPANQLLLQDFFRFILDCTLDARFTADNVIGRIEEMDDGFGWFDRILYRVAVIPQTREKILQIQSSQKLLMSDQVTDWGRGRVDTFNPYKGLQFNWQLERLPPSEIIAASDFPSLWNQAPRDGMHLHWDGDNSSLLERNLSASLGAGVTPVTVDHERLTRVREWVETLPPPPYPFAIDRALAERGQEVYRAECLDCHADHRFKDGVVEGEKVGTVEPIGSVGTDPYRLSSYTAVFAANQWTLYPDSEFRFTHFRKTGGYANQPLDGIWARAPYLHNGSVPTLRDLLEPPESRPAVFYRGYDVYDQQKVGFVSDVASENGVRYFLLDTSRPANGNGGHLWGTELPPEDKDAIVEYMKTF